MTPLGFCDIFVKKLGDMGLFRSLFWGAPPTEQDLLDRGWKPDMYFGAGRLEMTWLPPGGLFGDAHDHPTWRLVRRWERRMRQQAHNYDHSRNVAAYVDALRQKTMGEQK